MLNVKNDITKISKEVKIVNCIMRTQRSLNKKIQVIVEL